LTTTSSGVLNLYKVSSTKNYEDCVGVAPNVILSTEEFIWACIGRKLFKTIFWCWI